GVTVSNTPKLSLKRPRGHCDRLKKSRSNVCSVGSARPVDLNQLRDANLVSGSESRITQLRRLFQNWKGDSGFHSTAALEFPNVIDRFDIGASLTNPREPQRNRCVHDIERYRSQRCESEHSVFLLPRMV